MTKKQDYLIPEIWSDILLKEIKTVSAFHKLSKETTPKPTLRQRFRYKLYCIVERMIDFLERIRCKI